MANPTAQAAAQARKSMKNIYEGLTGCLIAGSLDVCVPDKEDKEDRDC